jgi:aminoglycoside phosphotransferase family enzyme/predicted kinase
LRPAAPDRILRAEAQVESVELVAALRNPAFYDPPVERVDFLQTHISSLFLTGERVYKLKKPVNFGFLDFSTVELRERYCRAEVELNRRLAPEVYIAAQPITCDEDRIRLHGDGPIVDWVVVMNQLDERLLGEQMLARGELAQSHLDQLVELLVPFYATARAGPDVERHGTLTALRYNTDENFAQTESVVGKLIARPRWEHLRAWTERVYDERSKLFRRRVAEGRIRDGHGDLHLSNIFFQEPPVVFDCIEFSERLRCGDPASDLAFLAMDLDFRQRPDLADYLIDRYIASSGDHGLRALLDYYKCYRAIVRAKVSAFAAADPALDHAARRHQRNQARRYFGLAYRYTGGAQQPPLVVVYGLMGTGKTAIANFLRERYGWHVLSTDAVRKQLAGMGEYTRVYEPYDQGLYSPEMNREVYAEICERAENLLLAGFAVVVDGSFKRLADRQPVIELAQRTGARLLFLETVCAPQEQQRRLEARRRHDTRSDGRVELMQRQRLEFDPAAQGHGAIWARIGTDAAPEETWALVAAELQAREMLAPSTAAAK